MEVSLHPSLGGVPGLPAVSPQDSVGAQLRGLGKLPASQPSVLSLSAGVACYGLGAWTGVASLGWPPGDPGLPAPTLGTPIPPLAGPLPASSEPAAPSGLLGGAPTGAHTDAGSSAWVPPPDVPAPASS